MTDRTFTREAISAAVSALRADAAGNIQATMTNIDEAARMLEAYLNTMPTARDIEQAASLDNTGKCAYAAILEMVEAADADYDRLEELRDSEILDADETEELAELEERVGDCESREDAQQRIVEDPLSFEVRSDWTSHGDAMEPAEFRLLLATGGPAVRIIGELDASGNPKHARLQVQDWFTEWTDYLPADRDTLLSYCQHVGICDIQADHYRGW